MFDGPTQNIRRTEARIDDARRNVGSMPPPGNGPRPSIPAIVDEQVASIVGLLKVINELEHRLSQVLSHEPAPADANRLDPPEPTQIAERLVLNNRGIDFAQQRIGQLMQRLHL